MERETESLIKRKSITDGSILKFTLLIDVRFNEYGWIDMKKDTKENLFTTKMDLWLIAFYATNMPFIIWWWWCCTNVSISQKETINVSVFLPKGTHATYVVHILYHMNFDNKRVCMWISIDLTVKNHEQGRAVPCKHIDVRWIIFRYEQEIKIYIYLVNWFGTNVELQEF